MSDIITPVTDISQVWGMPAAEQAELLGHFTNDELLEFQRLLKVRVLLSDRTIERCKTRLLAFVKQCWKELEPGAFIPNWHHELICEYLEYQFYHPLEYNKVLINVQPRVLKPVYINTMVLDSRGVHVPIKDIQVGDAVISHTGKVQRVTGKADQGELDCIEIKTHYGRSVTAALDHPFLTPDGWVDAGDLAVGDAIAVVHTPEVEDTSGRTIEEFRLAGYMVGDGCAGPAGKSYQFNFTKPEGPVVDDFIFCVESLGLVAENKGRRMMPNGQLNKASKIVVKGPKGKDRSKAQDWLRASGLAGYTRRAKHVPEWVYRGSPEKIAAFIGAYFACDGTVTRKKQQRDGHNRARTAWQFSITTISPGLAHGVQHLALRLGINVQVSTHNVKNVRKKDPDADYLVYTIRMAALDEMIKFARIVPVAGPKAQNLAAIASQRLGSFTPDMFTDKIKSIEPVGKKHCQCIEVENDHSYTVNDLVCHNSMICSVFFPCWVWLHRPGERFLCLSYAGQLANNHNFYRRRLIQSDTYRQLSADRPIDLLLGKNRISEFQNTRGGEMISRGMDGAVTGVGGTWIMCLTYGNVILTNQGPIPIGKIVEERLDVQVATYNHDLETVQYVPIDRYEKNIDDRDLIEIDLGDGQVLECTCDHPIYVVGKGYIKAEDIQPGDEVLCP